MKRTAAALGFMLILLASPNAYADIFAAVSVIAPAPRTDLDIAIMHASTGLRMALPAGVNTTADEIHPSITPDGKRLVFGRIAAGVVRVIVLDLSTGAMSDLFTSTEALQNPPLAAAIIPSGAAVVTGGEFAMSDSATTLQLTETSLQSFPTGPYSHKVQEFPFAYGPSGPNPPNPVTVAHVAAGGSQLLAIGDRFAASGYGTLYLVKRDGTVGTGSHLFDPEFIYSYFNPALAANSPQVVFFEQKFSGSVARDIVYRPASLSDFNGFPTPLPAIVNTELEETHPAVTADGRYVAFLRGSGLNPDFLFVWDTQTQTLLNTRGVSLGGRVAHRGASVSLFSKTLLNTSVISSSGNLTFSLAGTSGVGILVQRIVGRTTLLERPAYELEFVGRVPLGTFPEGHSSLVWDLTVNGEPLEPGWYLVTLRAVDGTIARALGRPHVLVIPDRH